MGTRERLSLVSGLKKARGVYPTGEDGLEVLLRHTTADLEKERKKHRAETTERRRFERALIEVVEKERKRLGEDLHDGLCQFLSGLVFIAHSLEKTLLKEEQPHAASEAGRLAQRIHEAVELVRDVAKGLHSLDVDAHGLPAALRGLAARTKDSVRCRFESRGDVQGVCNRLDEETAIHLYRIAQEAVANALKHAKPSRIMIGLSEGVGGLELAIKNDGAAFPEEARPTEGMGLSLMRYRADAIGGSLVIESLANGSTCVKCWMPMRTMDIRRVVPETKKRRNNR